jgi:hypothetical protein
VLALCGLATGLASWGDEPGGRAQAGEPGLSSPIWTELELEARKLFLKATTRVAVKLQETGAVRGDLRTPPEGVARRPTSPRVAIVNLESDLPFGRFQTSTVWVDALTGAALQGERLASGRKPSWKLWRYLDGARYVWRAEPGDSSEARLDRSAWTRRRDRLEAWESSVPPGLVVSDSYALLYLVSAARLERDGAELRFCLEADGRLVEARFVAGEVVTDRFELEEVSAGVSGMRSGLMRARAVRGLGRPVGGEAAGEEVDLGFLGLQGEITVLLAEGWGVPLEVRGRAQGVGQVTVRVRRVVLGTDEREGRK